MSFTPMDVLLECLDEAGAILMKHFGKLDEVVRKGPVDVVTAADYEAEQAIVSRIQRAFPHHEILAEEGGGNPGPAEWRWLIDPLDGTINFAHAFPAFCVSIALEHQGEIILAGIEDPYHRERWLAQTGQGATMNGRKLAVSQIDQIENSLLATGFPYDRHLRPHHYLKPWPEFLRRSHGIRRMGSAALDLCSVAIGRMDAYWEENLNPWDSAAGILIVREAGGRVTTYDGDEYNPFHKTMLASNGLLHDACLSVITA